MKEPLCIFCDGEASIEYYEKHVNADEIYWTLANWKMCTAHARRLDEAHQKREIEKTVA